MTLFVNFNVNFMLLN